MINDPIDRPGYTLTQTALAIRFECDPSTVRRNTRKDNDQVAGYVRGKHATWREHWKARRYSNGMIHGYEYVRREGSVERVTLVTITQDKDPYMLKSILGNLQELKGMTNKRIKDGSISMLGVQVLADNISWLQDFIEKCDRPET